MLLLIFISGYTLDIFTVISCRTVYVHLHSLASHGYEKERYDIHEIL